MKLPKVYEPRQYESDIYALWEKSGAFVPKHRGSKGNYSIVMPPPNANGNLHIGYELTAVLEDIPARYHRMKGDAVLLLPGADHAGFESQVVYEKHLAKEGKSRFDFTREELYKQIWDFVTLNRDNFESQLRKMGTSCDWSRFTFTLDDKIIKLAYATFKKMWDEGLIYRGERLVNFCTFHGTGFADIEVEYKELQGKLWHIRYPLVDGSGELVVATTRPETMLGDTAVAVHPKDERYKAFIGKTVKLPLTQREIPVIADSFVDREFGTGAVKITPAHDPNDYEAAKRHDLPFITVIDHEGKLTHDVPEPYRGLSVEQGREAVVADLESQDCLVKVEEHIHNVGHCYKCGTIIQPLLREQWFVDMQPLAKAAIKTLREDKINFYPGTKKNQLITYLKGLRDWNISRQIAWGIPIPAFQNLEDPDDWIFDARVTEEIIEIDGKQYRRDPDVFDTWFSSSSWPYATMDFPDGTDFKQFYPTDLMDTGGEILYPWVSRMIMLGLYVTGDIPFKDVYIHGYVMAEDGSKMSKSIGNVVDPLPVIEKYGSDALRMGIISGRSPGVNSGYDSRRVEEARNFCNKLWNIARFVTEKHSGSLPLDNKPKAETIADEWILQILQQSTNEVSKMLEQYRFAEAYDSLYHLVWDNFADWYIEASKTQSGTSVLAYGLETILKLAHPFAPFLTETIWQTLSQPLAGQLATEQSSPPADPSSPDNDLSLRSSQEVQSAHHAPVPKKKSLPSSDLEKVNLLITSSWPEPAKADTAKAAQFEEVKQIVNETRYIKGVMHLRGGVSLFHKGDNFIREHADLIKSMARVEDVKEVRDGYGLHLTAANHECWLDLDQETAKRFLTELKSKAESEAKTIEQLESRLSNRGYVSKAPAKLVEESQKQLEEAKARLDKVREEYQRFSTASSN